MAIAINYKLTYQDDLDRLETSNEYSYIAGIYGENTKKTLSNKKNVIIDETKINIESKNHRRVIQWQDFTQFRKNARIFLLYGSKNKFVIIPKKILATTAEIDNVRKILESKIG